MRKLIETIASLGAGKNAPVLIAIDGRAAAGKTTLAEGLAAALDCNVFHMDDFFLPSALRTAERLAEPGGNVHYERFYDEVLVPLGKGEPFSYGVFDCGAMAITAQRAVMPKAVNVIEGSYSHHPYFGEAYDLKIFLTVTEETQWQRILRRNGEEKAKAFRERWIPMEERYFRHYGIMERSHMVTEMGGAGGLKMKLSGM